jgi:anamorsin
MTAATVLPTTLSISIGGAQHESGASTESSSNSRHVERLRDFPSKELSPHSLDALGILVTADDLLADDGGDRFSPMDMSSFVHALKPGASVHVCVVSPEGGGTAGGETSSATSSLLLQKVHTAFVLAGLRGGSESKRADGSRVLSATRVEPAPASSSAAKLAKKPTPTPTTTVKIMNLDGDDDDDDDLLDEDALLSSDALAPPPAMSSAATKSGDDCGGRKACDNCTCGRADAEKASTVSENTHGNSKPAVAAIPSSSCGKCGLGDAFRCASCPYLGKPAFKAGEEHLVLDLQDDL